MKPLTTDQIRRSYLDFFVSKGHTEWPSDSLIPTDDPTLLFTGAGMNQFKDMFLGIGTHPFTRATTAQKCLRTGDIDNVGRTAFHHTFFEMMGNFSFGDYFKKEAIEWAMEWLTCWLEIEPQKLYFSVYLDDDEAYNHWAEVCVRYGLEPRKRIFRLGEHDNFWPADSPTLGPNGVCGPCSEIFFDTEFDPANPEPDVDITQEGDRFCEIWNLVFTQFDRRGPGILEPLPRKNIDTGLGLERMAAVLQGVDSNYLNDVFLRLTSGILSQFGRSDINALDPVSRQCIRRIADHMRAVSFCIADGALPGNAERGYVVRRLIRRAHLDSAYLAGDYDVRGLSEIVPMVIEVMGAAYPDLSKREMFIREIVEGEQEDFIRTLNANEKRLVAAAENAEMRDGVKVIPGETAFRLFDTYGVPVEVMEDFFDRKGVKVDREGFERSVDNRRRQSRDASRMKGDIFDLGPLGKALDVTTSTEFIGYEKLEADGLELLMMFRDNQPTARAEEGDKVVLVFDRTPFYAESGGQVGDNGYITGPGGLQVEITNVTRVKKVFFHYGEIQRGSIVGREEGKYPVFDMRFSAQVAPEKRAATQRNHTSTHLLHWALREVVGRHCEQAGSLVEPTRLRFDYTHFSPLTTEQIEKIERLVNSRIVENHRLRCYTDTLENARKTGVIALFGEKYEDVVRIVDIGGFSKELCGGCHVLSTGEIGSFAIIGEEAVAAGIRRITAVTGLGAAEHHRFAVNVLSALSGSLGVRAEDLPERVSALQDELKSLRSELARTKEKALRESAKECEVRNIGGKPVIAFDMGSVDPKTMRNVMDTMKPRVKGGLMLLAGHSGDNVTLLLYVDDELVSRGWNAGELIRPIAKLVDGSGGGRPQLAQAGGKNPSGLSAAIAEFLRRCDR
ncbi:MAG: alanine--tRNA ligase [Planctomycetota bacterium]